MLTGVTFAGAERHMANDVRHQSGAVV